MISSSTTVKLGFNDLEQQNQHEIKIRKNQ